VPSVTFAARAQAGTSASDDFQRADSATLGPNWTAASDAGLAISSGQAVGTNAGGNSGGMWTASAFASDQYSQVTVSATALTGSQWVGPAVRMQAGGMSAYTGIYYWNFGSPELMLFLRNNGGWTGLGSWATGGPLPAGTVLSLSATGSTITFSSNGVQRISVVDPTLTGGTAGILTNGTAPAAGWAGGSVQAGTVSVGGTVSGMTGGVLALQDNGGDTTSISANGSFTFPSMLAPGATYNVTVSSYPSGQTCQVTNGTGTAGTTNVTNVAVACQATQTTSATSDNFQRADSATLGSNWTPMTDGSMAVSSAQAVGTGSWSTTGDIWTSASFTSDQYSQVTLSATALTGSQWIGTAVRAQNGGQDAYVGMYWWNNGSPELEVFLRHGGAWQALAGWSTGGALAAGAQLRLTMVGDSLSLTVNGIQRVATSDTTLTGGAPGIVASGTARAAAWASGNSGFQASYQSTSSGIASYTLLSSNDGHGPQTLRVVKPASPAAGVAHNFLIVLPVEAGLGSAYGDGLATMKSLGAQDKYNLTIVEPTFAIPPWYADNPTDSHIQYEKFLTQELVPWLKQNLATTGHEQVWLIGFSKSGIGGQDLILKHPDIFTLAASWDFPADISAYNQYGDSSASYGTDANFQSNYRLTPTFVQAHAAPFQQDKRIWIGGFALYQTDMSDYNTLLTSKGVLHTTQTPTASSHTWTSGWVPGALAALYTDSTSLH
jgi:hypothetical protein